MQPIASVFLHCDVTVHNLANAYQNTLDLNYSVVDLYKRSLLFSKTLWEIIELDATIPDNKKEDAHVVCAFIITNTTCLEDVDLSFDVGEAIVHFWSR